ncbi:MAG: metal ABC transporter permease [Oscillospiraceae bacterium]|nr:metal ABC transporter permease [Oscillospiraceae bacterium]
MIVPIFEIIIDLFQHSFVRKAIIVGVLVSLCAALLGVSLVLKRYSMIGDGLSHVSFGTLGIAFALGISSPLYVSVPLVIVAAFALLRITENSRIKGDAAIALVSSSSLAIGVIIIAETKGMNADVYNYMFGTIAAIKNSDFYISVIISIIVLVLYIFFYSRIFTVTFDEPFARATGVKAKMYNTLLAALTAIIIVIGMRIMGAMLISSLIIFPALTAMRIFKSFKSVVVCSGVLSVFCFFTGIILSVVFDTSAGAVVVVTNLAMFLIFSLLGLVLNRIRGVI